MTQLSEIFFFGGGGKFVGGIVAKTQNDKSAFFEKFVNLILYRRFSRWFDFNLRSELQNEKLDG